MASRLKLDKMKVREHSHKLAWNHVSKATLRMEESAKADAPVRKPNKAGIVGGRLRSSIGRSMGGNWTHIKGKVGSNLKYAEVAHQGADFHIIRPRHKRRLSFIWDNKPAHIPVTKTGRYAGYVSFSYVRHPGMDGVSYLTRPLRIVGRGMGFRVVARVSWSDI